MWPWSVLQCSAVVAQAFGGGLSMASLTEVRSILLMVQGKGMLVSWKEAIERDEHEFFVASTLSI